MTGRTCPVTGCHRALGTTKNGDPWAMCQLHYAKLTNPHRLKLWTAYRAWQRLDRKYLAMPAGERPPALLEARAIAVKEYIEIRDDCIEYAGRGEAQQLEMAR